MDAPRSSSSSSSWQSVFDCTALRLLFTLLLLISLFFSAMLLTSCSSETSQTPSSSEISEQAEMSVVFVLNACDGVAAQTIELILPEGSTAFDALQASGIAYIAEESQYGMYVTSIAGVEASGMSGWVYKLNGEDVFDGCDSLVLSDGDTLEWSYLTW